MWKHAAVLLFSTPLLGACERYTEQTSPCFGRNGTPVVSRAAFSFPTSDTQPVAGGNASVTAKETAVVMDCNFEELPRPA